MKAQQKKYLIAGVVAAFALVGWWVFSASNVPDYPKVDSPRPTLGSASARVKVEEFSDFECPACKAAEPTVAEVLKTFGDQIYFSYHHFPLVTVHLQAYTAALAAECANDQGKFWQYHDSLFEHQPQLSKSQLKQYAADLKLNTESFNACLDSRAKQTQVRADMAEADKRGVNSTPTFFVNGTKVQDWTKLKEIIQSALVGG
jgi:protein-disulfide isomerase